MDVDSCGTWWPPGVRRNILHSFCGDMCVCVSYAIATANTLTTQYMVRFSHLTVQLPAGTNKQTGKWAAYEKLGTNEVRSMKLFPAGTKKTKEGELRKTEQKRNKGSRTQQKKREEN